MQTAAETAVQYRAGAAVLYQTLTIENATDSARYMERDILLKNVLTSV